MNAQSISTSLHGLGVGETERKKKRTRKLINQVDEDFLDPA